MQPKVSRRKDIKKLGPIRASSSTSSSSRGASRPTSALRSVGAIAPTHSILHDARHVFASACEVGLRSDENNELSTKFPAEI